MRMSQQFTTAGTAPSNRRRMPIRLYVHKLLSRRNPGLFLSLVLLLEGALGLVVIRDWHKSSLEVGKIYVGSVRGLRRIGDLQYYTQETRRTTLYALTTNDGNLQVNYADQSREADHNVMEGIVDYLSQAQTPEEQRLGLRLKNDWSDYLAVRDEVLGRILENDAKPAIDLDLALGVSRFGRVQQDLQDIKFLYDRQASQGLATMADYSRRSVIKLAAAVGFGLLFGCVAIWAIQQSRMRNAMQLAKLQMDFVASVSHELRTPITAILSAGENIRDGLIPDQSCLREQGSIIATQASHLTDIVGQVLLYAATGKDKPWHDMHPLEVSEVVELALRDIGLLLQITGISVEQEIQPGLPMVDGDLSVLSQCLQNLLVNAVKYSGRSRSIGISARTGEAANDASEVRISVRDYGIGIGRADLPHVFEPFYRSHRAVVAGIRGTGLGLSIAKRGAEASGGQLTVISEEGVGSIFTLHLPASKEPGMVSKIKIQKAS